MSAGAFGGSKVLFAAVSLALLLGFRFALASPTKCTVYMLRMVGGWRVTLIVIMFMGLAVTGKEFDPVVAGRTLMRITAEERSEQVVALGSSRDAQHGRESNMIPVTASHSRLEGYTHTVGPTSRIITLSSSLLWLRGGAATTSPISQLLRLLPEWLQRLLGVKQKASKLKGKVKVSKQKLSKSGSKRKAASGAGSTQSGGGAGTGGAGGSARLQRVNTALTNIPIS